MKKIELLAPAGNMEALVAAVQAGCDAVYIGGNNFGARAFSKNFTNEEIVKAINYAHLYGVKVYITVNTLIYDSEVPEFLEYIEFIHKNNVDAVLIQDIGMFDLLRKTFPNLELHASTQMHIHNLDGVKLMEGLGIKRVVLARETPKNVIENIIKNCNTEIEVFVHGALCISYSGECLMSSLIGGRSGNRGVCAGACRLKYDVIDEAGNKLNKGAYPLSTKDLNSLEYIGELIEAGVSSLKIEGRMKSKEYVYKVVSMYRMAIDSYYKNGKVIIDEHDMLELKKIFNRNYTKGFLNYAENSDIINDYRPNHMGVLAGKIINYKAGMAEIKLSLDIAIGCGLRVIGNKEDVGILVNEFYKGGTLVKEAKAGEIIRIKVNSPVAVNDKVVITVDSKLNKKIDELINSKARKVLITGNVLAKVGKPFSLTISDGNNLVKVSGNVVDRAKNKPLNEEDIVSKINKLGDTIYTFDNLEVDMDKDVFVPLSEINDIRRKAVQELSDKRLYKYNFVKKEYTISVPDFKREKLVTCLVNNMDNYKRLDRKYDAIYADEEIEGTIRKFPKVILEYPEYHSEVMVSELGGLNVFKNCYTDNSLNVVNSYAVAFLHSLGVRRVTLSYELSDWQLQELIEAYVSRYKSKPNLELVVSGYEEAMVSKYSLNKQYKKDLLYLKDVYGNKFRVIAKNGYMYVYNYKRREKYNPWYYEIGINALRVNNDI